MQRTSRDSCFPQPASSPESERSQQLLERALSIYGQAFLDREQGREWLSDHALGTLQVHERHGLGFSDGRLTGLLPKREQDAATRDQLESLGILSTKGVEALLGCIVFPIHDLAGTISGACGVHIDSSHQVRIGTAQVRPRLWNAPVLKRSSEIILVNSILDALSVECSGSSNVLACIDPDGLDDAELDWFRSCHIQKVMVLCSSRLSDELAQRLISQLRTFGSQMSHLPGNLAPNEFLVVHGPAKLATALAAAGANTDGSPPSPYLEPISDGFAIVLGTRRYQVRGLDKGPRKLRATVRVEQGSKMHVDTLDFYTARWRRQLIGDVARIFEETAEAAEAEILKLINICENHAGEAVAATPEAPMSPKARQEAVAFGRSSDLFNRILEDYEQCGLIGEEANKLLYYLAAVSRKLDQPLSVLILSSSGAGKSALQEGVLRFCPPEEVVKVTMLSSKALFYKEAGSLKHKVLALEEGEGMMEASYAIRNLVSAGSLVIESTRRDMGNGKMVAKENRVEGPTAVFLTTTNPETDPETKSRFFVTSVDEGPHQTQAILASQRHQQTLAGLGNEAARKAVLDRHHNFQRLLKPLAVINPYADQLSYGDDRLQSRRDQPRYLNLIRAVAFLRQMRKEVKTLPGSEAMPYIEVDLEDIRLANDLAAHIMGHSLDELSRPAHDLLLQLEAMTNEAARENGQPDFFTRRQIREYSGWNHSRVHRYLKELVTLEYVLVSSGRGAFRQTYRLCYNGEGKQGQRFLLGLRPVEELKEPELVSTVSPSFHSSESSQASTACRVRSKPVHSSKKGKAQ